MYVSHTRQNDNRGPLDCSDTRYHSLPGRGVRPCRSKMARLRALGHWQVDAGAQSSRLVGGWLRGDSQSPSNCPLGRRVLGMVLQRERFKRLGNDFATASPASIDARMAGCFSGLVLLVERRTGADFYVIAAPKECHGPPSSTNSAHAIAPSPADRRGISHKWPATFVGVVRRELGSPARAER